jgi:hypothetical protein
MRVQFIALALLASCAGASHQLVGPATYSIQCKRSQSNCWKEAAKVCPSGYDQIDGSQRAGTHHMVNAYNGQYMGSAPTFDGEMLVRCRQTQAAGP